jgi:hypothetical protein
MGPFHSLMIAAAVAIAPPPSKPAVVVLEGTVLRAVDDSPVAFANVVVVSTRWGTATDELGRFRLSLPPGPIVLRIQGLGDPPFTDSLHAVLGDTMRKMFRVPSPRHERFLRIRDSLTARGLWPPTLDPAIDARMREAPNVRVLRLDGENPSFDRPPDLEHRIGPWPIIGEARPPGRLVIQGLIETLHHSDLYMLNIQGSKKLCSGGFSPGVDVHFTDAVAPIDLLICYKCGEFSIWAGTVRQGGDFESQAGALIRFAKRMFPRDSTIQNLDPARYAPSR